MISLLCKQTRAWPSGRAAGVPLEQGAIASRLTFVALVSSLLVVSLLVQFSEADFAPQEGRPCICNSTFYRQCPAEAKCMEDATLDSEPTMSFRSARFQPWNPPPFHDDMHPDHVDIGPDFETLDVSTPKPNWCTEMQRKGFLIGCGPDPIRPTPKTTPKPLSGYESCLKKQQMGYRIGCGPGPIRPMPKITPKPTSAYEACLEKQRMGYRIGCGPHPLLQSRDITYGSSDDWCRKLQERGRKIGCPTRMEGRNSRGKQKSFRSGLDRSSEPEMPVRHRKVYLARAPTQDSRPPILHKLHITIPVEPPILDPLGVPEPKPLYKMKKYTTYEAKQEVQTVPVEKTIIKPEGVSPEDIIDDDIKVEGKPKI